MDKADALKIVEYFEAAAAKRPQSRFIAVNLDAARLLVAKLAIKTHPSATD
jgi:hypothetical protein